MPYAVAAGVATEAVLGLRLSLGWKLAMAGFVLVCLLAAVLLGAYVARLRLARMRGEGLAPVRHIAGSALRIAAEAAVAALVGGLASLALLGALDLAVAAIGPAPGAGWPAAALRAVATFSALSALALLLVAATALAASAQGAAASLPAAGRRLLLRAERATAVACIAIVAGTAVAILATRAAGPATPPEAMLWAALAKAAGYLAAVVAVAVGGSAIAAEADI